MLPKFEESKSITQDLINQEMYEDIILKRDILAAEQLNTDTSDPVTPNVVWTTEGIYIFCVTEKMTLKCTWNLLLPIKCDRIVHHDSLCHSMSVTFAEKCLPFI